MQTKGHSIQEYQEYKNKQAKNPRKRPCNNDNVQPGASGTIMPKKQRQLPLNINDALSRNNQQVVDDLIISFIVDTMSPIDIVEHQAFKNLLYGNIAPN